MKNLSYIFISSLLFISCFTERIDLELNNENNKRVVVDAWLNNIDSNQVITLFYTSSYFESEAIEYINNAKVVLKEGGQSMEINLDDNGRYPLPRLWRATIGESYELSIEIDDQTYTATNIARPMPEVTNVYPDFSDDEDRDTLIDIYFTFTDSPGEGDGYYGIDYPLGTTTGDSLINGAFIDDEFIDGEEFLDVSVTEDGYEGPQTIVFEIHSIGKDASRFLQDIIDETFRDGLFDPAPVNVRSNFDNGAVGYFIVSGSRRFEVEIN